MSDIFFQPETYISLLTLTIMEIVLGIDNIIFISIVADRLPKQDQKRARTLGLALALIFRIALLGLISWIVKLTEPLFSINIINWKVTGRDLILLGGGLFLISKSTVEIHSKFDEAEKNGQGRKKAKFLDVVIQIVLLDIVFSFDSVITAVGLVDHMSIMVIAVIISLFIMLIFSTVISDFVNRNPTIKMLALSFLLMIGTMLLAEGCHFHVPKGYIYFAMAFSIFVECMNLRLRKISEKA